MRHISFIYDILWKAGFCLPVCVCLCVLSCSDELEHPSRSSRVSFNPSVWYSYLSVSRGAVDTFPGTTVPLTTDDGNGIFLHTSYTDGIVPVPAQAGGEGTPVTRGTPIKGDNMYATFGVSAYAYTGSWNENRHPNFMYDIPVTRSGDSWAPSSDYYWPGEMYKTRFFAYAPRGNAAYRLSGQAAGAPTITCTIPADVAEQEDLLVAGTGELDGNSNSVVNLTFQHALTAVKFVCGSDMQPGTVKSVVLRNVCSGGVYNMETGEWSDTGGTASFSQTLDRRTNGTEGDTITFEPQTFMMIPQTLPDSAAVEIVFNDGKIDRTLKASIKNSVWPKGKTVTYRISTSSINWRYILDVTAPKDMEYYGGSQNYSVSSYRENASGVREPVSWNAVYSTDGGITWTPTKPEWLATFTAKGDGGITATSYSVSVCSQTISPQTVRDNAHIRNLQDAPSRGTAGRPYNLSNSNGDRDVENTANCYIVGAPGVYSLPLVYGNAIKEGKTNEPAYRSNKLNNNMLDNFLNHRGDITDPYINNNTGCEAKSAELVWQDAMDLLADVELEGSGESAYVSFSVNKTTIQQGNAVIAVKDAGGTVLWSWHIWVTDRDMTGTKEITNYQGTKYELMPVDLGWCDGGNIIYEARNVKVKFTQGEAGETKIIMISQKRHEEILDGNAPYYQWGRKDPFPPSVGKGSVTNKTWYDAEGKASSLAPKVSAFQTGKGCITDGIQNPAVMNKNMYMTNVFYNLWDASCSANVDQDSRLVKTIYDPTPVGFHLPNRMTFTGFVAGGKAGSNIKGFWNSVLHGWNFYCNSRKEETVFFPVLRRRLYDNGKVENIKPLQIRWLASAGSARLGGALSFPSKSSGALNPRHSADSGYGITIRAVRE